MIEVICYISIFIVEVTISLFYFEYKFQRNISLKLLMLFAFCSFVLSFGVSRLNIHLLNIIIFFIVNFVMLFKCYKTSIQACIFNISLLIVYMIVTELVVLYSSAFFFNFQILPEYNDTLVTVIQIVISKLLYFLIVYITAKLSLKENRNEGSVFSLFLSVLPICSILFMHITTRVCLYYDIDLGLKNILVIGDILILFSNIIVFYVYEYTLSTNRKYILTMLEKQSAESNEEYYKLLGEQNENSRILIHDMKKHLNAIRNISQQTASSEAINNYIDEIIGGFDKSKRVDYCGNTLLNLITYRYFHISEQKGIDFQINIRDAVLGFISDYDITSIFDNLLENAVEAAELSEEKFIDFSIYIRNENFIIIKVSNSFSVKPSLINGHFISSKKSTKYHGIGINSIRRTVSKYNGNLNIDIDEDTKIFCTTIVFKIKNKKTE